MEDNLRIYVGGINGVGKTTVCGIISNKFDLVHMSGSKEMLRYFGFKNQKQLENLDEKSKTLAAKNLFIPKLKDTSRLIFDTHYIIQTKQGLEYLFLNEYKNIFDLLLHINASPRLILERRRKDLRRRHRSLDLDEITSLQIKSQDEAKRISKKYNIPLIQIDNNNRLNTFTDNIWDELAYFTRQKCKI